MEVHASQGPQQAGHLLDDAPRAGRCDPFCAPDTNPPLVRAPGDILCFRAHAPAELGVFVKVPLVTTLKCWSWLAQGIFETICSAAAAASLQHQSHLSV